MRFRDACILAFCRLGVAGLAPRAPGTWGTALACLLAPVLFLPFGMGGRVLILLLLFVLGALAAGVGGLMLSYYLGASTGACITLCLALIFGATFLLRRRQG